MAQNPDTTSYLKTDKFKSFGEKRRDSLEKSDFAPKIKKKKEKVFHPDSTHSPHKAVIRSLLIPGWGQVYNHQIYFVPIIYGVLGLLADVVVYNNKYYKEFLTISQYREHGIVPVKGMPEFDNYNLYAAQSNQALYDATDSYRRDRDLGYLGIVGFWGINAIQAYVAAKFQHSYSIDTNLSMKVAPSFTPQPIYAQNSLSSYIPGIKITFALK